MTGIQSEVSSGEIKRGWPIVSSAAIGIGLGLSPLPFYTIGIFIGPMAKEFGWAPSQVLYALLIYSLVVVFIAPFIGLVADKIGARKVVLVSIVLFGLSMMLQSLHTGSIELYLFYWSVLAVFGAGTLPITFTKAINNWFDIHRGKALGMALVTTGIFGALAKFFAAEITALYGWRTAYVALGCLPIFIAFPIALVAFRDVDDTPPKQSICMKYKLPILTVSVLGMGALAYFVLGFILPTAAAEGWKMQYVIGTVFMIIVFIPLLMLIFGKTDLDPPIKKNTYQSRGKLHLPGVTLLEATREWRFWMLGFVFIVISFAITGVIPNIEQILLSKDYSIVEAVGLASLTGFAIIGGRIIGGFLIDKYWAPGVAFVFLASPAFAFYILSGANVSSEMAAIAIMMIGFGAGVEYDFMAYLVSKYFGMRGYSSIYGAIYSFFAIGGSTATAVMLRTAEADGNWQNMMTYSAIAMIVGSLPLLLLGKYREFPNKE